MRSVPRIVLLVAALALPVIAVVASYALTDGPRAPQAPAKVQVGVSPGPDPLPTAPSEQVPPSSPSQPPPLPPDLPPPPPDDDLDDDLDDDDD